MAAVTSGRLELDGPMEVAMSPGVKHPASCRLGEMIKLYF